MAADLCPNCFESGYQNGSCRHCGYKIQYDKKRNSTSLPAGTILNGRYYVGRVLGQGGFGITYKAYDINRKTVCAVKEYAPGSLCFRGPDHRSLELGSEENEPAYMAGRRRFHDEAQILSRLEQIPSVVTITDTFQENKTAYFAMEYLDGADLRQIVKASKRLPYKQVTDVILQAALSMDVIHNKTKIIHRDISPENIYITRSGKVKVIDFGSAKRTETGMKKGLSVVLKPRLAPPEQFSSEMVQGAFTDVYSLAATYYYVLTGSYVPSAPDRLAGMSYVPLKQLGLGVPDGVSDAVDHALTLNVHHRTPNMQVFVQEIVAGMNGKPVPEPKKPEPKKPVPQPGPKPDPKKPDPKKPDPKKPVPQPGPKPGPKPDPKKMPVPASVKEVPYVAVVTGPEAGRRWNIPANRTLIFGRSLADAQLRVQYPENISRLHCQITYDSQKKGFRIRDTSGNGTYYKGKRLQKNVDYFVKPSARLALSSNACVIEMGVKNEHS